MFAVELKFELGASGRAEDQADAITWLTAALVRNGNLLKEFLVRSDSNGWTVYGIIPARDAFHRAHWNNFVLQRMSALRSVKLKRPRIRVLGAVPETATPCRCTAPKGFFLFTTFLHVEPPLWCIDCNGIMPLYRLPPSPTGEHSGLLARPIHRGADRVLLRRRARIALACCFLTVDDSMCPLFVGAGDPLAAGCLRQAHVQNRLHQRGVIGMRRFALSVLPYGISIFASRTFSV
jgi:hypothetical protein